jgi:hypothetical protein
MCRSIPSIMIIGAAVHHHVIERHIHAKRGCGEGSV